MAFEGFRRLRNLAAVAGLTVPLAGDPGQTLESPAAPGGDRPQACDTVTDPRIAPPSALGSSPLIGGVRTPQIDDEILNARPPQSGTPSFEAPIKPDCAKPISDSDSMPTLTFVANKGKPADKIRKQIEDANPDIYKIPEPKASAGNAVPDMSPPADIETPEMPDTVLPTKRIDA